MSVVRKSFMGASSGQRDEETNMNINSTFGLCLKPLALIKTYGFQTITDTISKILSMQNL